jgi:hypothetical protein
MKSSMILTKDQQQALLEILKEIISVFWGPDLVCDIANPCPG